MAIVGSFPTTLQNGTTEDATQVMSLFSFIQSQINSNACPATSGTSVLKANGSGGTTSAIAGTDYAAPNVAQSQTGVWCGTAGGTANAIALTPSPAITAYAAGQRFSFLAASTNTLATTINVSGLGPVTVAANAGDIQSGKAYSVVYDGTQFQLSLPINNYLPLAGGTLSGALTLPGNATSALQAVAFQQLMGLIKTVTLNIRPITANGTYTPSSANVVGALVFAVGGGGQGGGSGTGSNNNSGGGGGGAGGMSVGWFTYAQLSGGITCTIGAAGSGSGGTGSPGAYGGATTFGTLLQGNGGGGGGAGSSAGGNGGIGGGYTGTSFVFGSNGQPGTPGSNYSGAQAGSGGSGGSTLFGGGGYGPAGGNAPAASPSNNYGGGGAGSGGAPSSGAAGEPGVIHVWEFVEQ